MMMMMMMMMMMAFKVPLRAWGRAWPQSAIPDFAVEWCRNSHVRRSDPDSVYHLGRALEYMEHRTRVRQGYFEERYAAAFGV